MSSARVLDLGGGGRVTFLQGLVTFPPFATSHFTSLTSSPFPQHPSQEQAQVLHTQHTSHPPCLLTSPKPPLHMRSLQPPIPASAQDSSSSKDPSAAQSSLRKLHEQTLAGGSQQQKKDDVGVKTGEAAAAAASPKGKPRLLLMGQRR